MSPHVPLCRRTQPIELKEKPRRKPLPDHLERIEQVLSVGEDCPECGGDLSKLGEDITEELEYIPGRFVVNKITRPRMACRRCEAISQAPMPSRPIERGRPGPGLLAHVLVSRFAPWAVCPKHGPTSTTAFWSWTRMLLNSPFLRFFGSLVAFLATPRPSLHRKPRHWQPVPFLDVEVP